MHKMQSTATTFMLFFMEPNRSNFIFLQTLEVNMTLATFRVQIQTRIEKHPIWTSFIE